MIDAIAAAARNPHTMHDHASIVASLEAVLRDLSEPRQQIEATFLALGGTLVECSSLLKGITDGLDSLAIGSNEGTGTGSAHVLKLIADEANAIAAAPIAHEADVGQLIVVARTLGPPLADLCSTIRALAMMVTPIKIAATELSSAGDEFEVFTDEIARLSSEAESALAKFSAVYDQLIASLTSAHAKGVEFSTTKRAALQSLARQLEAHVAEVSAKQREAARASADISGLFGGITQAISRAVPALQIGDITRQRIEHAEQGLSALLTALSRNGEAGRQTGDPNKYALVTAMCRLQSAQVDQAIDEFDHEADKIVHVLRTLSSDANAIIRQGKVIQSSIDEQTRTIDVDLAEHLAKARSLMAEFSTARDDLDGAVLAVNHSMQDLLGQMETLNSTKSHLRLIGLNMALKCAHLGSRGRTLTAIAREMGTLSNETVARMNVIRQVLNNASSLANKIGSSRKAAATSEQASNASDALAATANGHNTSEILQALKNNQDALGRLLDKAADKIMARNGISSMLRGAGEKARTVLARAAAAHDALGGGDLETAEKQALAAIRDTYTMASERQLHDRVLNTGAAIAAKAPPASGEDDLDSMFL